MARQFQKMTQGLLQSSTETGICRYGMIKGSLVEKLPICGVLQITRKGKKRKVYKDRKRNDLDSQDHKGKQEKRKGHESRVEKYFDLYTFSVTRGMSLRTAAGVFEIIKSVGLRLAQ